MRHKGFPELRVRDNSVVLKGNSLKMNTQDGTIVVDYQGERTRTDIAFHLEPTDRSTPPVEFRHMPHQNHIIVSNNTQQTTITWQMGETAHPGRKMTISTSHTDPERPKITFRNTARGRQFNIQLIDQYTRTPEEENADAINDVINNPYTDSSESLDELDLKAMLSRIPQATQISTGGSRTVFSVDVSMVDALRESDGHIIKVADGPQEVILNKRECQTWQAFKSNTGERFFCPITSIGRNHKYIIMKEATNVGELNAQTVGTVRRDVKQLITTDKDTHQLGESGVQTQYDIHSSNVGMCEEHPVLVDYPYGANFEINSEPDDELFSV